MSLVAETVVVLAVLLLIFLFVRVNSVKVYRFYRPGCSFCVRTQDEWNSFKYACMFKMIRPIDINMDSASDGEKALYAKFGGNGVPMIVKDTGSSIMIYAGDRTAISIMSWVKSSA